eukprot:6230912-Alexandrium_andersonii.AAC.1
MAPATPLRLRRSGRARPRPGTLGRLRLPARPARSHFGSRNWSVLEPARVSKKSRISGVAGRGVAAR